LILELYVSLIVAVPIFIGVDSLFQRSKRYDDRIISRRGIFTKHAD